MSTPMWEMPDHWLLPVNIDGDGPADADHAVRWACACDNRDHCPYMDPLPDVECVRCQSPNDPMRIHCAGCARLLPRPPMTLPALPDRSMFDECPVCEERIGWDHVEIHPSEEPQCVLLAFHTGTGDFFHTIHTSDPKLGGIIQLIAQKEPS